MMSDKDIQYYYKRSLEELPIAERHVEIIRQRYEALRREMIKRGIHE